uniref:hypothetical protein n=1 Tax=uncultured Allobacillus sp. TaxID=1638025 RepID=UPI00259978B9|nr:hypothetical protein [uncultured Allobacillus sp.]
MKNLQELNDKQIEQLIDDIVGDQTIHTITCKTFLRIKIYYAKNLNLTLEDVQEHIKQDIINDEFSYDRGTTLSNYINEIHCILLEQLILYNAR